MLVQAVRHAQGQLFSWHNQFTAGDEEPAITGMGTADMDAGWPQLDTVMETGGVAWTRSAGQCWVEGKPAEAVPPFFAHLVLVPSLFRPHNLTGMFVINNKQDSRRQVPASLLLVSAEHGWSERAVSAAHTARAVPGASPF